MASILIDTHLLLWAAGDDPRLSEQAREVITDEGNRLLFSTASIWEVVIKSGLGRDDFRIDPAQFRRGLLDNGYLELPVTSQHTLHVAHLPGHHRDPFDRLLIAQAMAEGIELVTGDRRLAEYGTVVRLVV